MGLDDIWFQQDGATCHAAKVCLTFLREIFPGKLISRFGDIAWPPRSPDLTVPDFFFWGYLKERVYRYNPKTIRDLKETIQSEIRSIPTNMISKVMENTRIRMRECVARKGGHLLDIIYRR